MEESKKNIMYIFPISLFYYFFIGLKALLWDIWYDLFNKDTSEKVPKKEMSNDEIYNRTKLRGKEKKVKVYNYSKSVLKKLAIEKEQLMDDLQKGGATRSNEPHLYYYKVRDKQGKILTGTIKGYSKLDINTFLLSENYDVYVIKTSKYIEFAYGEFVLGSNKMNTKDLIFWLTQLSTYLKAGIKLNESIKILNTQMKGSKAKENAFKSIAYELTLGESFSDALKKQGDMFPALLINMIKAAEASGTLEETLDNMAGYYTEMDETKKQMISAVTYPAIILTFAFAVIIFVIVYVVPQFEGIYASSGIAITGMTKILIDVSYFLKANYLYILLCLILGITTIVFLIKKVKIIKIYFQLFLMKIPLVKNLIIYNELTIFSKTFSSLLKNNVYITESVDILSKITDNEIYKSILYKTISNIVNGEKISDAFKDHWAVPDVAYYMIVTGESTGQLADMMEKVSDYYQKEHKNIVNNLKTFLEPVIIVFLAVVVGIILVAVIVPMFDMYKTVQ